MANTPSQPMQGADLAGLKSRAAALRKAAALPRAEVQALLDAALAELDGAIDALSTDHDDGAGAASSSGLHSERRLLHAVFTATPVPLYIVDKDGTVVRANAAAAELLGVGPGYATGKALSSLVDPAARAALRSQLAVAGRTGNPAALTCGLLGTAQAVRCELVIQPVHVRGDSIRLLVAVRKDADQKDRAALPAKADHLPSSDHLPSADQRSSPDQLSSPDDAVVASARRLDLLAAASRLLLASATVSEAVLLQRCAQLLQGDLATWVIVDVLRRDQLRRHFAAGPDDPESARLAHAVATADPTPGSAPDQVAESGKTLLITHVDDDSTLGNDADGNPLLPMLGGAALLSVPLAEGDNQPYGILTLVNDARSGQFGLADVALAEDVGALLCRSVSARRTLRRRTETAAALEASLLPPVLKPVPGIELAPAHMAPTRGREVGGDFYDAYPTPGGWGVAIGDVCGKGEDAAAATAAARHAIRVLAHWNEDPAAVLRDANEIMLAEEFGGRFVTAAAAHLSWHDQILRVVLASAGHPGAVLVNPDGRAKILPGGGLPLGIFADAEPSTLELELTPGDVLFFYTDGLSGARNPRGDYLEERLTDMLAALAGRSAAEIVSDMGNEVLEFSAGTLLDDLTMLALRIGPPPSL
ncbi:MAG TPA: SpoIIE family protein phosphatase [Streptosporangiaceae bacterium]|nr:SpoIIE family protein phosphatase [Streptosporangiaceae bacterium]